MASIEKENWFGQTNTYNYLDLMIALYKKDKLDLKMAHAKLGGTGVWIDIGRFTKGKRLHNPNGLLSWSLQVQRKLKLPSRLFYHMEVTFLSRMKMLPQKMRN